MLISMTKGLVREVISLVSWVVAFYVATHYGDILIPWLPNAVSGDVMRMIVAFIVLFIGTRIVMAILARLVNVVLHATGLTLLDRFLGALFGLAKGAAGRSGTGTGLRNDENTAAAVLEKCNVQSDGGTGRENDHAVFAGLFCGIHTFLIQGILSVSMYSCGFVFLIFD